ncbi:BatA domain-containing protein [Cytophagaceae bacterium DM2B3-1]|uniref:BatA domain-containing protein n=1 Tax=Xanthocytophaga flava TaxID=3048013 RepID=A0ABT7CSP9_9BACT|nr:BatA domain-containing protein [Xanthocytophaga flavus]MDJ1495997.1 BatA domain-containing protein [Xanthocytophaga flavus]
MWQAVNPVYWWGLGALAIPILIHLYNRRPTKVKILGSLRWLTEVQPAQANFRRVQQWPLLLIRLALLVVVILLLVDLYTTHTNKALGKLKIVILIHPEAGDSIQFRQLAQKWQNDSVQVRWLTPRFSVINEPLEKDTSNVSIWSLLAEADKKFPSDSIHVIAPDRSDYWRGKRIPTQASLSWELTPVKKDTFQLVQASLINKEPELLWFYSSPEYTGYVWEKGTTNTSGRRPQVEYLKDQQIIKVSQNQKSYEVSVGRIDTLQIAGAIADQYLDEWHIFQVSVRAVAAFHKIPVRFVGVTEKADWLVSMGKDLPIGNSAQPALWWNYYPDNHAGWIQTVKMDSLIIHKKLSTGQVLEGGWLQAIRPYVLAFKTKNVIRPALDYRKIDLLSDSLTVNPNMIIAGTDHSASYDYRVWFGMAALVLLALERIWPKQAK